MSREQEPQSRSTGPCMIRVVVREDVDGPPIHDKIGDFNEKYFREWIDKTQWWAMRNQKSMGLYPA